MSITKLTTNGVNGSKYDTVSADNYYMEPIATTLVGAGGASSISFTNIPQNYKHLQLRGISRATTGGAAFGGVQITFNGDTTSGNYTFHRLIGDGSTASAYGQSGIDFIMRQALSGLTAGIFAANVVDILDYSNVYKFKTARTLNGGDNNSTAGVVGLFSQLWMNTAGITSISLTSSSGNFAEYSRYSLYGIKG